jgi:5-methyltetrahydropteroyltriglutamate--homocysteine methyltransferase
MFDLIDELFIPETIKLLQAGANWIQMDEPALTTHPEHVDTFVDAWNYWVSKIHPYTQSNTVLSLHNCFSNYDLLWPILPELDNLGAFTLEYANRDTWELGRDASTRKAYHDPERIMRELYGSETGFKARAALGVLPVHTDHITNAELIRDRLLYINSIIGNPELVLGAPDCGLRQRSLQVSHELLENLHHGAELARQEIGV